MKISESFIELSKVDSVMSITIALDIFAIAQSSSIFGVNYLNSNV